MELLQRIDYNKFSTKAPDGYRFSAKKMTQEAKNMLESYWTNALNHDELYEECLEHGFKKHDWEWITKYSKRQNRAFIYLTQNKFIVKAK